MTSDPIVLTRGQLLRLTLIFEGALLVVALIAGYFMGETFWALFSLSWTAAVWGIGAALPPLIIIIGISESPTRLGESARRDFGPVLKLFKNATLIDILFVSVMAGLCEEALFRGALQVGLALKTGPWIALVIASLIFGVAHALSPSYFTFATLIGIYFGSLLIWTDSLLIPMLAHAVYDFIAILYGTRWSKVLKPPAQEIAATPEPEPDPMPPQEDAE